MSAGRSKWLGRIVIVAVLAVGAILGVRYWQGRATDADGPPTFHGNVDIHDVTLAFRISGRVVSVLKQEGDRVTAGEVIARLDDAPYRAAVDQAQAALAVARAQLKRVEAPARVEDRSEARAMLAEREATAKRTTETYQRYAKLAETGAVTQQALTDARGAMEQSKAAVDAARAALGRVNSGARGVDIEVARAQVAQAESAVATAQVSLADTELKTSTAGIVATRVIEPGAIVAPGSPALVVTIDEPVWVRGYAAESQLAMLAPGTQIDVFTDARAGKPYQGQVGYVATQSEFTPKNVETAELRSTLVYRFRVVVTTHDGGLRQGMPVELRLHGGAAGSAR